MGSEKDMQGMNEWKKGSLQEAHDGVGVREDGGEKR